MGEMELESLVLKLKEEIDDGNKRIKAMENKYRRHTSIFIREMSRLEDQIKEDSILISTLKQEQNLHHQQIQELGELECIKNEVECLKRRLEQQTNTSVLSDSQCYQKLKKLENENRELKDNLKDLDTKWKEYICASRKELEEELEHVQYTNKALFIKERAANQELQDAREEALHGLQNALNIRTTLRIKRMGEVNPCPFKQICEQKYSSNVNSAGPSALLCSVWQKNVSDPHWHPFKRIEIDGKFKEVIDENDGKLKGLRSQWGEEIYDAVTNALLELNEYNPSGRYPVPVIWDHKRGTRADLKEIVAYLISRLKKTLKRKR